jgi:hypothetical protein
VNKLTTTRDDWAVDSPAWARPSNNKALFATKKVVAMCSPWPDPDDGVGGFSCTHHVCVLQCTVRCLSSVQY